MFLSVLNWVPEVGAVEIAPPFPHGEEHRAEDDVEREEEEAGRDRDRHQPDVLHQLELDHSVGLARRRRRQGQRMRGRGQQRRGGWGQGRGGLVAADPIHGGGTIFFVLPEESGARFNREVFS